VTLVATCFAFLVFAEVLRRIRRHARLFRMFATGRDGEDAVVEVLRSALDRRWTILRNVQLPDRKGDLDVVLVGPGGVWVLEVKTLGGTLRVRERALWERRGAGPHWSAMEENPSKQAQRNALRLRDFLQREAVDVRFVEPAVVLAKGHPVEHFTSASPPVWLIGELGDRMATVSSLSALREVDQERIVACLREQVTRQRGEERAGDGPEGPVDKLVRIVVFGRGSAAGDT